MWWLEGTVLYCQHGVLSLVS
eukprot:COSAG06_NODE_61318_length_268_cov_0.609467_1_plen_20_part_01